MEKERELLEQEKARVAKGKKVVEDQLLKLKSLTPIIRERELKLRQWTQGLQIQQEEISRECKSLRVLEQHQAMAVGWDQQQLSTNLLPQVPNMSLFSKIGSLSEYHLDEDWDIYEERLIQYFLANDVSEERKVSFLITLVDQEVYTILKNLCDPVLPASREFTYLCGILRKHFAPERGLSGAKLQLYFSRQGRSETINMWYAKVKTMAAKCDFGIQFMDEIKKQFVTGLKKGPVLDKVSELDPAATLEEILEVARHEEATVQESTSSDCSINRFALLGLETRRN